MARGSPSNPTLRMFVFRECKVHQGKLYLLIQRWKLGISLQVNYKVQPPGESSMLLLLATNKHGE